jgi:hypothetical protein
MPISRPRKKKATTAPLAQALTPAQKLGVQAFVRAFPEKTFRQNRNLFELCVLVGITPDEITLLDNGDTMLSPSAYAKIQAVPELAEMTPYMKDEGMVTERWLS